MWEEDDCPKDYRCELMRGHEGPCKRYVQHDSMCGCSKCATDYDAGFASPRFDCVEI